MREFILLSSKITVDGDCSCEIKRLLLFGRKTMTNLDNKQRHYFADKGPSSQKYGFSSSHVQMWELNHKEGWAPVNLCFWTVLEKTLESPLDSNEIKQVNPKRNSSWIFIGRTEAEAEHPVLWPPDAKSQLFGEDCDAGKDRRLEEKEMTMAEIVEWHHWLDGHEFEQTPGDRGGQRNLVCCSPWGHV